MLIVILSYKVWGDYLEFNKECFDYIDWMMVHHDRDNANISRNPENLHKYTADKVLKEYTLKKLLDKCEANAHINCDLHIHDLEYFPFRPLNCLQHDIRFFIRNGLKVDGDGRHTNSSRPAKHLVTLINHIGQILGSGQVNMSGGQSIPFFNTFIAPYTKGLSDREVEQAMQMFVYNLNMSYVSRGGQTVFSSVNLDLELPKFLFDVPAWYNGGIVGYYGDYEDEIKRVAHILIKVMSDGDSVNKPFLFPNTIFHLNDKVDFDEWDDLFNLSSKYSTPYFSRELGDDYCLLMGCRTRLGIGWTGDWDKDLLRTGNIAYITLNLPKYALQSGGDLEQFYEILYDNLQIATNILMKRREHGLNHLFKWDTNKFLTQPDVNGESYYRIDNGTLSFGFVGLYETLKILGCPEDFSLGEDIVNVIRNYAEALKGLTPYRWTVIASPAESVAGRFANYNRKYYGESACVNGSDKGYYYSNSSHLPVDSSYNFIDKIRIEGRYHKYTNGGNIAHIFLGQHATGETLKNLTKKVYDYGDIGFWAYTNVYMHCNSCNNIQKVLLDRCNVCNSEDVEYYDRITGYLQKVSGWNDSKMAEFKDRRRFNL